MRAIACLHRCAESGVPGPLVGLISMQDATDGGVRVYVYIWGHRTGDLDLNERRSHALHIHESGNVFTPGCAGACAHYKRPGQTHGLPGDPNSHAGDLGNLDFREDRDLKQVLSRADLTVDECLGRSFILHAGQDRGRTSPPDETGGAGARVAAGVIGRG